MLKIKAWNKQQKKKKLEMDKSDFFLFLFDKL